MSGTNIGKWLKNPFTDLSEKLSKAQGKSKPVKKKKPVKKEKKSGL